MPTFNLFFLVYLAQRGPIKLPCVVGRSIMDQFGISWFSLLVVVVRPLKERCDYLRL